MYRQIYWQIIGGVSIKSITEKKIKIVFQGTKDVLNEKESNNMILKYENIV